MKQQIVAEPVPTDPARTNPYVVGDYAPIDFETTSFALPVKGTLPKELSGRLLRIGPNPSRNPSPHWFVGLGMAHGVRLHEGRAEWYRSRFVRAGNAARAIGIEPLAGPAGNDASSVNTTVLHLGDGTHACVEGGAFPVKLSYELDSVSRTDLGGGLTRGFAAHARTDPRTSEHFAIAYQGGVPRVQYLVVDRDGVARQRCEIDLSHMPLIHDIGITQSSVVVFDFPSRSRCPSPDRDRETCHTRGPGAWRARRPAPARWKRLEDAMVRGAQMLCVPLS